MSQAKRKPGRPATVDTQLALKQIVELFRSKGYAAVSLDDLSEVTGLSRPSLYRAFGNKLSMYLGAMDAFGAQVADAAVPELLAEGEIETVLANFFHAMLRLYYRDAEITPGCLVFGTAPSSAEEIEVQSRLRFGIEQTDKLMRSRFMQAAPRCDAAQMTAAVHLASNTQIAFSARAKSGATQAELENMGTQSARQIARILKA